MVVVMKKSHWARSEIHSVADLGSQSTVKYGVVEGGVTGEFFKNSLDPVYARMWQEMAENPSGIRHTDDGLQRVLTSSDQQPWAFVTESSEVAYFAGQRCDLEVIRDESLYRYVSLAMPVNSHYRGSLDISVINMFENGELQMLREKWCPEKDCSHSVGVRSSFHFPERRSMPTSTFIPRHSNGICVTALVYNLNASSS